MLNKDNEEGVLWVASSKRYVEEAILSKEQLSQTNPNLSTALVTSESDPGTFDHYIQADFNTQTYGDKITGMQLSPFDTTLFLDTDCYALSDISNIFELKNKYDICCKIDPIRTKHLSSKLPDIYPELNSGVILYDRSLEDVGFFDNWYRNYEEFNLIIDMPSFSYTTHNSDLSLGIIPPEYNYTNQPQIVYGEIKILHARLADLGLKPTLQNINKLEKKINRYSHLRVSRSVPLRKIKFDYVEVRGEFSLLYQFLYSVWFNGPLYTLQESVRHLSSWLSNQFGAN